VAPEAIKPALANKHTNLELSLDADGFDKSASNRERDAGKAVLALKPGAKRGNPSASLRRCRTPRTAPQTPGEAQKRPRLRALRNVERRFHLTTLVEGTYLSSKLLGIGRLPEFAVGSICSGNPGIETLPSKEALA